MKVLILAGGLGSRISEETTIKPKPMVEIGDKPILWHIMKMYSHFGFNEFAILLGYKGHCIKEYFANYALQQNDVTISLHEKQIEFRTNITEPWRITLLNTGDKTMTGGRIKRAEEFVGKEQFLLTYGDGVANVNIPELIKHHRASGKTVTLTAVQPEGRFGALNIKEDNSVITFNEKPRGDKTWINGGFFVCEPEVFNFIQGDDTVFEQEPLIQLAEQNRLTAYRHYGFWKCMDTLSDKNALNKHWKEGNAPWKIWNETEQLYRPLHKTRIQDGILNNTLQE